ncbi:23S rRNA (cytidine(2498)-2'-O)-methyltransferase RlmM [Marinimicrobium sp. ARAG 43.8]|uniref:23S rRNA (cytidine(2498)-2'-O)-methyltransferase RlmM n=1 Tax=Marinimicrobium sp. ARAG 43.8 TaxID=3418719 RepID=UPI003CE9CD6C
MNHLFLHCRPGFEKECAAEIQDVAAGAGFYGFVKAKDDQAHVVYVTHEPDGALALVERIDFSRLIFARQWFVTSAALTDLPPEDRVGPLVAAAETFPPAQFLMVETPDTNHGKALSTLGKKLTPPLLSALKRNGHWRNGSPWYWHLLLLSGQCMHLGISPARNRAAWPMGIPRLRQPKSAPSRATLKLEEAWHHFIPANEWDTRLAGGQRAVDLGAAPGGWTWQLVQRGFFVDAVDNGPMDDALMESGQVTHWREDGFVFEPKKAVDWLVCDIADKPARVASMIAYWVKMGWCREAIFNLKLPMKQRYAEVCKLRDRMYEQCEEAGVSVTLSFKQLYHDREEVTGHIRRLTPR